MAPKEQTTAQPQSPQAARRPHRGLWLCPGPRNQVPRTNSEMPVESPTRPALDQDLRAQV